MSVGRCLNRVLEQWEPLFSFIKEETDAVAKKRSAEEANLGSYRISKVKKLLLTEDVVLSREKPKQLAKSKVSNVKRESSKVSSLKGAYVEL